MRFLPRLAGGFLPRFTAPLLVLVVRVLPGYPFRMEYHRETDLRPAPRLSAAVLVAGCFLISAVTCRRLV
ncbi:hypothetical protein AXA88_27080, partial [Salmonella enterica]|nr:hypothetical protein [Salmonella enterica]EGW6283031.1 hypothetical protein [Salmonella enterica]EGX3932055.1 hypothetical protein [Salmonella enterica]